MQSIKQLILYRNFEHGALLERFAWLMEQCGKNSCDPEELAACYYTCFHDLTVRPGGKPLAQLSGVSFGQS